MRARGRVWGGLMKRRSEGKSAAGKFRDPGALWGGRGSQMALSDTAETSWPQILCRGPMDVACSHRMCYRFYFSVSPEKQLQKIAFFPLMWLFRVDKELSDLLILQPQGVSSVSSHHHSSEARVLLAEA